MTDTLAGTQGNIQNGIDLVTSGGTVLVLEGTYELTNTLNISKPLTLTGNVGDPTSPGAALDAPVIQHKSGGTNTAMVISSSDVTVQGFIIKGFETV
jgi:hypothetical protein